MTLIHPCIFADEIREKSRSISNMQQRSRCRAVPICKEQPAGPRISPPTLRTPKHHRSERPSFLHDDDAEVSLHGFMARRAQRLPCGKRAKSLCRTKRYGDVVSVDRTKRILHRGPTQVKCSRCLCPWLKTLLTSEGMPARHGFGTLYERVVTRTCRVHELSIRHVRAMHSAPSHRWCAAALVLVVASLRAGRPIVSLCAASAGLPLIASSFFFFSFSITRGLQLLFSRSPTKSPHQGTD